MIFCRAKTAKKQGKDGQAESGNILIWILIAVVLFAALNFVMSQGLRSGAENISGEKTALVVNEMLDYSRAVESAVKAMLINGCKLEGGLSFHSSKFANPAHYTMATAPADKSCHIFSAKGGGITWQAPPTEVAADGGTEYVFASALDLTGVGTSATDLIMMTRVPQSVCIAINDKFGITNTGGIPPNDTNTSISVPPGNSQVYGAFRVSTGGFSPGGTKIGDATSPELVGQRIGCFYSDPGGYHLYYYVLAVR